MAYTTMKKLILNANARLQDGTWTKEQYGEYREANQKKLDVLYASGRLTESQYGELTHLWIDTDSETDE